MICELTSKTSPGTFDYDRAFSRNIGLLSRGEQLRVRQTCVAIPGLGGVGGSHAQALARLGVCRFRLADLDVFDVPNLNRQLGASIATLGRSKVDVVADTIRSINPESDVRRYPGGINSQNISDFLNGVDVVIDGLEFYCIAERRMLFRECHRRQIPIITAGPIGYGAAILVFTPEGPSFDEYFGIDDDMTRAEQLLAFGLGLSPSILNDFSSDSVDTIRQTCPALVTACLLCSAAAATEVLKLISGRGKPASAPHGIFYDLLRNRTLALRRRPSLTHSIRGRILRWATFRQFPAFHEMHAREVAAREAHAADSAALSELRLPEATNQ